MLGLILSACGDSGGSSINSTSSQTLDTWTDESTDATVPVTDLRMVKIATTATDSVSPLTSTIAVVNGTITALTDIKVWWNTVDDFTTATQVGIKTSPDVGGAYKISIAGAGSGSGFLYYTISIPTGTTGNYYMRVLSIEGASTDSIPLPKNTDTRNVLIPPVIPGEGKIKWGFQISSDSTPAIGNDGTIYLGSYDGQLYAIDSDGKLKWKYETGGQITTSPSIGSDGTIYVGSYDRQLYAINPDGTLKWVFPTRSWFSSSPAIGKDGTIYAGGTDQDETVIQCDNGFLKVRLSHLFAINPNGTKKWSKALSGEMDSSPAVATDGTIYIGTDGDTVYDRFDYCDSNSEYPASNADLRYPVNGHLYAINPINGSIKWDFKTLGDVDSSPAIGSDGTIYVGSDARTHVYGSDKSKLQGISPTTEGFVYAINSNGTLKWLYGFETTDPSGDAYGNVDSSPAIGSDGTIYFGSDKNDVFALNPNGTLKWVYPTRGDVDSSPAIARDGTIYVASDDGNLYALNPDGKPKWVLETPSNEMNSSPVIGTDGTIYFVSFEGIKSVIDEDVFFLVGPGNLFAIKGESPLADSPWPKFRHDLKNNGRK